MEHSWAWQGAQSLGGSLWEAGGSSEGVKAVATGLPLAEEGVAAAIELPKHALLKPQIPTPSDLFQVRAASW